MKRCFYPVVHLSNTGSNRCILSFIQLVLLFSGEGDHRCWKRCDRCIPMIKQINIYTCTYNEYFLKIKNLGSSVCTVQLNKFDLYINLERKEFRDVLHTSHNL